MPSRGLETALPFAPFCPGRGCCAGVAREEENWPGERGLLRQDAVGFLGPGDRTLAMRTGQPACVLWPWTRLHVGLDLPVASTFLFSFFPSVWFCFPLRTGPDRCLAHSRRVGSQHSGPGLQAPP